VSDVQPDQKEPSRKLVPVDDVVDNLPFIVRRDHRIVAAFARKQAAIDGPKCGRSMTKATSPCIRQRK
jgi:hypothetical protein